MNDSRHNEPSSPFKPTRTWSLSDNDRDIVIMPARSGKQTRDARLRYCQYRAEFWRALRLRPIACTWCDLIRALQRARGSASHWSVVLY